MGKDNTGYNVPFELAFEMIAAIMVDEIAMPILPKMNAITKSQMFRMTNESNSIENKTVITQFIRKTRRRLKTNLPEKTVDGAASNCSVIAVPRSSSETNARDKPDIAEKNITTQSNPPVNTSDIFSLPTEKSITLIVTRINIASALIA